MAKRRSRPGIAGVAPGTRLDRVLRELNRLGDPKFNFAPFPLTAPATLVRRMKTARYPEKWRRILANEVLLYLERAHSAGLADTRADAWLWCRTRRLPMPDWLRDASPVRQRGKRFSVTQVETFVIDFVRFLAVKKAEIEIAADENVAALDAKMREAKKKFPDLDTREYDAMVKADGNRGLLRGQDKYHLAEEFLPSWAKTRDDSPRAIEKSYRKLTKGRASLYFSPEVLMVCLHEVAPTVYELLLPKP